MASRSQVAKAAGAAVLAVAAATGLSPYGEQVLKQLEAFRSIPYRDSAGVWTDGYGNTKGVVPGRAVSEPQATLALRNHVATFVAGILTVTGPLTQGQLDSYTLLTYNIGMPTFASSTAVKAHKAGDYTGACLYATRYNKITLNGELVLLPGLAKRRLTEYDICIADLPPGSWSNETRGTR